MTRSTISDTPVPANKRHHRGSDLRDFLKGEGIPDEMQALACKRALALQLQRLLKENAMTKSEMASRMKTSRAAVDRLLDASNPSATLATIEKAARAVGRKLKLQLVPA